MPFSDFYYLPEAWKSKYDEYYNNPKIPTVDAQGHTKTYFGDYLERDKEFNKYAKTYLEKVYKILELAD